MNSLLAKTSVVLTGFTLVLGTVVLSAAEIDPLEVRPTLVQPAVSLPTNLVTVPVVNPGEFFMPPNFDDIPDDKTGDMVRLGRNIFTNTQEYGARYVGNGLNCVSCHLSEGRQPYAGPLWAAVGMFPISRNKNRRVVTYEERIQDCFKYSLDGIAPTVDSPEMIALVTYSKWLATGVPIGVSMPGRGFATIKKTHDPDSIDGEIVYRNKCAMCHGDNGEGQKHADGSYMFPPLWGLDSFNRAAGMNKVKTAATFIKANMPLGSGYTLSDDEALDVAVYMWIHFRPDDPRQSFLMNRFGAKPGGGG
ncbi:MAG TPA: c-type cytochrome [Chromatiaceae bacterium]|jgi:thiosulfate dehydrogenase|nr:c-type cytochrome [Chromatiaceae bacterium]HIN81981.1 c-type cytochrome [Chromatiales bacterium]HIA07577.1 c-type cytochrome [Chromatiaceae bacterium]HIB83386.1 c-type cytochrome [Chromatiaceae bacterium]HIO14438.1 c-type cytochrome [Chromatiales bacterium]